MISGAHQLACAALLVAACGAQSTVGNAGRAPSEQRTDLLPSELDLARDLEATVLENYMQLTLGNFDAYADGIARDRSIALLGIGADDVLVGREPDGARNDRRPYRKLGVKLLAKNLEVHLSEDSSVGWVYDELSYRVPYDGRRVSIPMRFTGVFVRDIDRWVMVVEHTSYALPAEEIIALARAGKLHKPASICRGKHCGAAKSDHLRALVRALHSTKDAAARRDLLATDARALLLWPDPDEEYSGAAVAEAPRLAELFGPDAAVEVVADRVSVSKSGKVAWVVANLAVRSNDEDDLVVRLRGTYVLELLRVRTNQFRWKVIQAHVSAPIEEVELSQRVFGSEP